MIIFLITAVVAVFASPVIAAADIQTTSTLTQVEEIILRLQQVRSGISIMRTEADTAASPKCGLNLTFDVIRSWEYFTAQQREIVSALLSPPQLQSDTVIGKFRIHYDTSGIHEPALLDANGERIPGTFRAYVDSAGRFFNEVWNIQIAGLGYQAPPLLTSPEAYDVYIVNLGSSFYGRTVPHPGQTPPRYTTYIEIHNDFKGFFSSGVNGLKVTAAHEFHHAIQLGAYGYWGNDLYFYEITSTWMEDVVYDEVNDYYQYIQGRSGSPRGHFQDPEISFNVSNRIIEYSRAIWGKYVEKRMHRNVMRRTWEHMRIQPSLPSLDLALNEFGSSLREAFIEFSLWNYYTGVRADTVQYYAEGRNYPPIRIRQDSWEFVRPQAVFTGTFGVQGLGTGYYRWRELVGIDTVYVVPMISNVSIADAGNGISAPFQYIIRTDPPGDDSYTRLEVQENVYWVKLQGSGDPSNWRFVHSVRQTATADLLVYPNPFQVPEHRWIRFQIPQSPTARATLYVYSSSLELAYRAELNIERSTITPPFVAWDGRTSNGEYASTGVYFYVVAVGDQQHIGKFSVIRK